MVQVIDNGRHERNSSRLCFERHATSKNTSNEDLFSLNTKVLEALASIAAIAHVEMKTKQDQESWVLKLLLGE
jgi:DNA mismatch repair protein MutL